MFRLSSIGAGILTALCLAGPAQAQIVITEDYLDGWLRAAGTQQEYVTPPSGALTALAAATGPNQTWDFSGLPFTLEFSAHVAPVEPPVPGSDDPHLSQATHITRVDIDEEDTFYTYVRLGPSAFEALGTALPDTLVKFLPGDLIMPLPLSSSTPSWTRTFGTEFVPPIPGITFSTERTGTVEGWGTLITPAGSADALRVRDEFVSTVTLIGFPPIVTTTFVVWFYTLEQHQASISLDETGAVTNGYYTAFLPSTAAEPAGPPAALRLSVPRPNPAAARQPVALAFSISAPGPVRLEVLDVLGRRVAHLADGPRAAGEHVVTWRADAPPGRYLVRLTAGSRTAVQRLTLVR